MATSPKSGVSKIQAPKGTRDLYPEDALKRRYLEQSWRDASIRCGFEEIHGPTFETTDLYAVKSGEGILGELFQAYSGKAPEEVEQVKETGRAPYAMRPEFTPTLARMYAAKAGSLPRPCKWFTGGPYFRAERPQRGRLREFLQWNVDVIGLPGDLGGGGNAEDAEGNAEVAEAKAWMDAECAECCTTLIHSVGFGSIDMRLHVSHRELALAVLEYAGATRSTTAQALSLLDRRPKISHQTASIQAAELGVRLDQLDKTFRYLTSQFHRDLGDLRLSRSAVTMPMEELFRYMKELGNPEGEFDFFDVMERAAAHANQKDETRKVRTFTFHDVQLVMDYLDDFVGSARYQFDASIVRGLAYYTGTVFEVLAEGERAIAGGGRYDKLIELMGGPPTPAVGFAMGDVVVSLLLEDKGLMPHGAELMEAVSRRPASVRPEVFVVGADDDNSDALVRRLSADLRRGVEADAYKQAGASKPWSAARYDPASGGVRPLHARVSYKSTRNLKKLLADGEKQHARLAAIVHGPDRVQLKDFDARRDLTPKDVGLSDTHAEFSTDPSSPVYIARAADRLLS